ncbi:unnamed protein product, partial [Prorocentrum cordatum]
LLDACLASLPLVGLPLILSFAWCSPTGTAAAFPSWGQVRPQCHLGGLYYHCGVGCPDVSSPRATFFSLLPWRSKLA